jgi:hypothetical protein
LNQEQNAVTAFCLIQLMGKIRHIFHRFAINFFDDIASLNIRLRGSAPRFHPGHDDACCIIHSKIFGNIRRKFLNWSVGEM